MRESNSNRIRLLARRIRTLTMICQDVQLSELDDEDLRELLASFMENSREIEMIIDGDRTAQNPGGDLLSVVR